MGKCIIIAPLFRGEAMEALQREDGDLLICADGGYDAAVRYGLQPDLVIGDFDSMPLDHVKDCRTVVLPTHKDDTDMVACLKEGRRQGFRRFCIAGCLGGRLDHTVANLQCLYDCALRGEETWMLDERNAATILLPGQYTLPKQPGRKLSLLSYTPETTGIHLSGATWELTDASLSSRYPLGTSNEIEAEQARLSFAEGALLVIYAKD